MRNILGGVITVIGFLIGVNIDSALVCIGSIAVGAIVAFIPIKK